VMQAPVLDAPLDSDMTVHHERVLRHVADAAPAGRRRACTARHRRLERQRLAIAVPRPQVRVEAGVRLIARRTPRTVLRPLGRRRPPIFRGRSEVAAFAACTRREHARRAIPIWLRNLRLWHPSARGPLDGARVPPRRVPRALRLPAAAVVRVHVGLLPWRRRHEMCPASCVGREAAQRNGGFQSRDDSCPFRQIVHSVVLASNPDRRLTHMG